MRSPKAKRQPPLSNSLIFTISKFQIMKKTYIIPATKVEAAVIEEMIAASITAIGGDSGLDKGTGNLPDRADVKESGSWDIDW